MSFINTKRPLFRMLMALLMSGLCAGIAFAGGSEERSSRAERKAATKPVTTSEFDLAKLDFSKAVVSLAGPRHLYIRYALYDSKGISFILESDNMDDEERVWKVKEIFNEDLDHLPDEFYAEYAVIAPMPSDTIEFQGFIIDGEAYTAKMRIDDSKTLTSFGYGPVDSSQRYDAAVAPLTDEIDKLKVSLQDALAQLAKSVVAAPPLESLSVDSVFTKTLQTGFSNGVTQLGRWDITENQAVQKDASQYFAKLIIPMKQASTPTLFSFKTRSVGSQWTGLGLHFFATDTDRRKGYGYGDSLLFWLTRDPGTYGTTDTHAQLYKSDNAVQMGMVLDAIIEEPISKYMQVDIIYNPVEEYFSVFIDGILKLKYKTWFDVESGFEIALRTLKGGCSFKDLVVRSME